MGRALDVDGEPVARLGRPKGATMGRSASPSGRGGAGHPAPPPVRRVDAQGHADPRADPAQQLPDRQPEGAGLPVQGDEAQAPRPDGGDRVRAFLRGEPGPLQPRHRPVVQADADDSRHCPTPHSQDPPRPLRHRSSRTRQRGA